MKILNTTWYDSLETLGDDEQTLFLTENTSCPLVVVCQLSPMFALQRWPIWTPEKDALIIEKEKEHETLASKSVRGSQLSEGQCSASHCLPSP